MRTFIIIASLMLITACNTVSGIGQDMKGAGNALQKAAD